MSLQVKITKKLANFSLDVDCTVESREILAVLGASGSGKSMLLKCIAGVETPDTGCIVLDDRVLFDSSRKINLLPQERRVGLLFQNYALFPNMTVYQNIYHSVRKGRYSGPEQERLINGIMDTLQLTKIRNNSVMRISGGEMQRTALARILVNDAELMMLDEPLSALDEHLKFSLEMELKEIIGNFGKSVLFVTHDRDQAHRLGDRIALVNDGLIEKIAPVREIFMHPDTVEGARITGVKNIAAATVKNGIVEVPRWGLSFDLCRIAGSDGGSEKDIHYIGIRMNDVKLAKGKEDLSKGNIFTFKIADVLSNVFSYTVKLYNPDVSDPLPFYWQISKDLWEPEHRNIVELYLRDSIVMPLK